MSNGSDNSRVEMTTDPPCSPFQGECRRRLLIQAVLALIVLTSLGTYPLVFANKLGGEYPFVITMPWAALFVVFWLALAATQRGEPWSPLAPPKAGKPRHDVWRSALGLESRNSPFQKWLLLYFAAAAASVLFAAHKPFCAAALVPLIIHLTLAYSVASSFDLRKNPWVIGLWMASATILSCWAMIEHAINPSSAAAPVATFGNRNFLAGFLAVSVWTCLGFAMRDQNKARRLLFTLWAIELMTVIVVACRSRGAVLATALAGGIMLLAWWRNKRSRFLWIGAAVLVAAAILAIPPVKPKLAKMAAEDVRPAIWTGTLRMIQARPWTGHGWGSFVAEYPPYRPPEYFKIGRAAPVTNHAHNEFLEITAEGGILALTAFVALLIFVGQQGIQAFRAGNLYALGFLGGLATWLVHNFVDMNLRAAPNQTLFWLLIGLIVAQNRSDNTLVRTPSTSARYFFRLGTVLMALSLLIFGIVRPLQADIKLALALQARARGDWPAAIAAYQRAIAAEPYRLGILERLGYAYSRIGALDEARKSYERLKSIAPDYGDVNTNLGKVFMDLNNPKQALPLFQRAVELNPYDPSKQKLLQEAQRQAAQ